MDHNQIRDQGRLLASKTIDAYSSKRYSSWTACAMMLIARGYSFEESEEILRSKWTRWAADDSRNKLATSKDLERFLNSLPNEKLAVQELMTP